MRNPLNAGDMIGDHFKIQKFLAAGSYGMVYAGFNQRLQNCVAIKIEKEGTVPSRIALEKQVYEKVFWEKGFPRVHDYIFQPKQKILITDLLGESLQTIVKGLGGCLSLKTTLQIAVQLLQRIESLHNNNFIHRDLKPDNLLVGLGEKRCTIFMIDFGLSALYRDPKTGEHIPYRKSCGRHGNNRFCSVNSHFGNEVSRRDDLESIGYILIYLLKGSLPWTGLKAETPEYKAKQIASKKASTPIEVLCNGLPRQFFSYLQMVRALAFDEDPNYQAYVQLFRSCMKENNIVDDSSYDWCIKHSVMSLPHIGCRVRRRAIKTEEKGSSDNLFASTLEVSPIRTHVLQRQLSGGGVFPLIMSHPLN